MSEGFDVPCLGVWDLTAERRGVEFEPDRDLVVAPLTRDELVAFARQIGDRREAWKEACRMHLADLWWHHPGGWK